MEVTLLHVIIYPIANSKEFYLIYQLTFTMVLKTVTKRIVLIISILLIEPNLVYSQAKDDYYSLIEGGVKYQKPIRYLLLDEKIDTKITSSDLNEIYFYKQSQRFKHIAGKHKKDTCSILVLDTIKTTTINQLFKDELIEHQSKLNLEKVNFPPPHKHYNLKIYIVEKISDDKVTKYEVEWLYTLR